MHPGPGVEELRREREDDSQGPGASASQHISDAGVGTTAKQENRIRKMED